MEALLTQIVKLREVWIPFFIALFIVGAAMWRVLEWAYGQRIERLEGQLKHLNEGGASAAKLREPISETVTASKTKRTKIAPRSHVTDEAAVRPEDRIFLPDHITPKFLWDQQEGHTAIQSEKLLGSYIGKWMKVEGLVYNATIRTIAGKRVCSVSLFDGLNSRMIHLEFRHDFERVEMLKKGDVVVAQGRLDSVRPLMIGLELCDLLEHRPAPNSGGGAATKKAG